MATATKKTARKTTAKKAAKKPPASNGAGALDGHQLARLIPVDRIEPAADNRDVGDIAELTSSIAQHGIIQPLVVTGGPLADGWLLVAGHRRLAAAKAAGLLDVPCVVRDDLDMADRLELRLIENVERRDLSPLEEASAYRQLVDEHDYTQAKLAKRLSRSQSHISKRLSLLDLPDKARELVEARELPLADALELAKLDADAQDRVLSVGNADNRRWRIESERRAAEREANLAERLQELQATGVDARRSNDEHPPSWRLLPSPAGETSEMVDEHVAAGIAGALVWADDYIQWFCTDPDHDHSAPSGGPVARRERTIEERARDRLNKLAEARAAVITEGLARLELADAQVAAFVAAQQLDIIASLDLASPVEILPTEEARLACDYLHVDAGENEGDDWTPGLRARLLDSRVNPVWILLALTFAALEEHLTPRPWTRHFDWSQGAAGAAIHRHFKFLEGHLGCELDPLEEALLEGLDLDDPKVQASCGLADDGAGEA